MSDSLNDYYAERIAQEAARRLEEMANVTDSRTNGITSGATLLPCPFCGGEAAKIYKSGGQTTHIECTRCRAQFPKSTNECAYDEAWNTRSVTAAAVMGYEAAQAERTCKREKHGTKMDGSPKLRCSLCGYGIGDKRWKFCPNCGAKVSGD